MSEGETGSHSLWPPVSKHIVLKAASNHLATWTEASPGIHLILLEAKQEGRKKPHPWQYHWTTGPNQPSPVSCLGFLLGKSVFPDCLNHFELGYVETEGFLHDQDLQEALELCIPSENAVRNSAATGHWRTTPARSGWVDHPTQSA